jgi:hypothetical protein
MLNGHGEKLSRKKEQAVAALLCQPTLPAAAAEAGVSERTLRTWLRQPDFAEAFARARREYLEVAISRMQRAAGAAATKLMSLLDAAEDGIALRAALGIIDRAVKGCETLDILVRVKALEDAAKRGQSR